MVVVHVPFFISVHFRDLLSSSFIPRHLLYHPVAGVRFMNGIKLFPPLNTSSKLVHDGYDRRRRPRRSIEFFMNIFNLPKDGKEDNDLTRNKRYGLI